MGNAVIFDGNYLFHKTRSIFQRYNQSDLLTDLFSDKIKQGEFFRKIVTDSMKTLRMIPDVESVVFVFDSDSWRKDYYPDYKKRNPSDVDDSIGWEIFYNLMEKFKRHMKYKGFIVSCVDKMEGDDMCYFWSHTLSSIYDNVLIISGDRDIKGILTEFPNVSVINNNLEKMTLSQSSKSPDLTIEGFTTEKFDANKFLVTKMLSGDSGDKVPNAYKGLGDKTVEKILLDFEMSDMLSFDYLSKEVIDRIVVLSSVRIKNCDVKLLESNLQRNIKLMYLHESVYTKEQLDSVWEHIHENIQSYSYSGEFVLSEILEK